MTGRHPWRIPRWRGFRDWLRPGSSSRQSETHRRTIPCRTPRWSPRWWRRPAYPRKASRPASARSGAGPAGSLRWRGPGRDEPSLPRNRRRRARDTAPETCGWDTGRNRAVRPVLDGAVRDVPQLVEARRIAGDLEIAPVDGAARPHVGVRLVDGANSVYEEDIPVNIRFERADGDRPKTGRILPHRHAPHTRLILGHSRGLGVQRSHACRNQYLGGLRRPDPESNPVIGANLGGNDGLWPFSARSLG